MVISRATLMEGLSGTRHMARGCKGDSKRNQMGPQLPQGHVGRSEVHTVQNRTKPPQPGRVNIRVPLLASYAALLNCLSTSGMSSSR